MVFSNPNQDHSKPAFLRQQRRFLSKFGAPLKKCAKVAINPWFRVHLESPEYTWTAWTNQRPLNLEVLAQFVFEIAFPWEKKMLRLKSGWANESGTESHAWVDVRLPFVHPFQLLEQVRHTWHCDSLPCSMISMSLMWLVKGALFGDLIFFTPSF